MSYDAKLFIPPNPAEGATPAQAAHVLAICGKIGLLSTQAQTDIYALATPTTGPIGAPYVPFDQLTDVNPDTGYNLCIGQKFQDQMDPQFTQCSVLVTLINASNFTELVATMANGLYTPDKFNALYAVPGVSDAVAAFFAPPVPVVIPQSAAKKA